jgi:N-acylneuraminate cytidylyltransferase
MPNIVAHKRAPEFCDEISKTFNEVVEHVATSVDGDILMWAPCVCPLTSVQSYEQALIDFETHVMKSNENDSVISAKIFKEYLFDENGPLNWNPEHHVPSQRLPEWKTIVNGFYVAPREKMVEWRYIYGKNPYLHILNKKEAVDIDDAEDFAVAKALLGVAE